MVRSPVVIRDLNTEADALSNLDTEGFRDELRVDLSLDRLQWVILPKFMEAGMAFVESKKLRRRPEKKQRKSGLSVREENPW